MVTFLLVCLAPRCAGRSSTLPPQGLGEYEVKAAFLLNFAKFVEFPVDAFARPDDPIVISVIGQDPFGPALGDQVSSKSVNGRSFVIVRQKNGRSVPPCHILFVSQSESRNLPQIIEQLRGRSVLTVGDTDDFARAGGMIRLFLEDDRVKMEINAHAAERAGLKISSKLLALARLVSDRPGGSRN